MTPYRTYDRLRQLLGDRCAFDVPMAPLTTWRVGGPADCLVRPRTAEELATIMSLCTENNVPTRVVGAGSNLLILDGGLRGVTILLRQGFDEFTVREAGGETVEVTLGAALSMAEAVDRTARAGLRGLEFAAGIPGSIGGGVRMNAGTTEGDFSKVLTAVEVVDADGKKRRLARHELQYRYRGLVLDMPYVATAATVALRRDEPAAILRRVEAIIAWRHTRHPYDVPSGGSTFKNPEGDAAGRLIEQAGLKGYAIGGAQVSEKHANFLVNTGTANAADILALLEHVRRVVFEKFGVMLEPEVKIWGERNVSE
ncbi:MAG TPA: UDP-N-acetylmuramate dehydrogenase [bacterium]|mgnify:CR=1 FL=1|nr:UDP-N-acetylmuramate dehydrogenase [bacterium]